MFIRLLFGFGLFSLISQAACAHVPQGIYEGRTGQKIPLDAVIRDIPAGGILILGENHGLTTHQKQHLKIFEALRQAGHRISVGFEFFSYPDQASVDSWRQGQLSETQFLKDINWGGVSFDFYRDQALFPRWEEGSRAWALNAPRALTSKVARSGLESLSAEEHALLPPFFELGRDSYRARFEAEMPHMPEGPAKDRYFAAQSIWDDTMAWRAVEFLKSHPEQTLVIIVGDFHVRYGGGLPDRIAARSSFPVRTLSQQVSTGLSPAEVWSEVLPSEKYGVRADWVWVDESRDP